MTKRRWAILAGVIVFGGGLLWFVFGREPIGEGRCRLVRRKVDPDSPLMWLVQRFVTPLGNKPDGVQDLPAGFEQPRYYAIQSGDATVLAVADFSQKLVRLCVDTDGDGVLSEERCFTAQVNKGSPVSGRGQRLGPISLVSRDSAGRVNDGFDVGCFRQDARGLLMPSAAFYRTGKVRLAGQMYQVAVVDGDCDGLFKSVLPLPLADHSLWTRPRCDVFAIDLNRDGKFDLSVREKSEVCPLGKLAKVGDTYYAIDIAPDGSSLALSRTEPQFGTLVLDANDVAAELKLWSDAADQYLPANREWQLPPGRYTATNAVLTVKDASGDIWTFSSFTPVFAAECMGPLDFFTIEPGKTTSVRIGPPFAVTTKIKTWPGSDQVEISPVVVGCAGEEYSAALQRNGGQPLAPVVTILDEKGTALVSGQCGYTGSGRCGYSWRVPEGFRASSKYKWTSTSGRSRSGTSDRGIRSDRPIKAAVEYDDKKACKRSGKIGPISSLALSPQPFHYRP